MIRNFYGKKKKWCDSDPSPGAAEPFLNRRSFLRTGLGAAAAISFPWLFPRFLEAAVPDANKLIFALIDHNANPNPYPTALRRMAWELTRRTSIAAELDSRLVNPEDYRVFFHPFLVLAGRGQFRLNNAATANLRRHITYGGMLFIDNTEESEGSDFDISVRNLLENILPGRSFAPVPRNHVLMKSFYLLDNPSGRIIRKPYLEGIETENRMAVVYSHNDLLGAWARDDLGVWEMDVDPRQREMAFRLGVNLIMYAMCLDYKDDQVHIPFILKRRRS